MDNRFSFVDGPSVIEVLRSLFGVDISDIHLIPSALNCDTKFSRGYLIVLKEMAALRTLPKKLVKLGQLFTSLLILQIADYYL